MAFNNQVANVKQMAQHVIDPAVETEGKRDDAAADGAFGRG
ncbi:MAG: hypothetical protein ACPGQM_11820 [Alphaproteobacteria bacterium]